MEGRPPPDGLLGEFGSLVSGVRWVALGAAGGFSGARIWRGERDGTAAFALKAWPPSMSPERLAAIHRLMARAAPLPFVPSVFPTANGSTVPTANGRVWDVSAWMPGTADFHANPTPVRLANAVAALARLHRAWRPPQPTFAPCPGVRRRLKLLAEWPTLQSDGLPGPETNRRARLALSVAADRAEAELMAWLNRPLHLQPCLCDVWGAHVLFSGDAVVGLIDYGAVKVDHVAVDLARLLGDLVGDDDARFTAGLNAYRAAGGALDAPDEFVRLLDRTGAVCAVVFWLLRLRDPASLDDPAAVLRRLDRLATRVERLYPPNG